MTKRVETVSQQLKSYFIDDVSNTPYCVFDLHGTEDVSQIQWLKYLIKDKLFDIRCGSVWQGIEDFFFNARTYKTYDAYKRAKEKKEMFLHSFTFLDKQDMIDAIKCINKSVRTFNAQETETEESYIYSFSTEEPLSGFFAEDMIEYFDCVCYSLNNI